MWLKSHEQLSLEAELPEGVPLVSHPLWLELARSLQFFQEMFTRVRKRKHINFLEIETILLFERQLARHYSNIRYVLGADSQVSLACLVKGRSSSPQLNRAMQRNLPTILGSGIYSNFGFIPSLANVADDPTHDVAIREPAQDPPQWLKEAFAGFFDSMDAWLESLGYDPLRVADLPFAEGTSVSTEAIAAKLVPELRRVQKPDRLEQFDRKFVQKPFTVAPPSVSQPALFCTENSSAEVADCSNSFVHVASGRSDVSHPEKQLQKIEQNGEEELAKAKPRTKKKRPKKKEKREKAQLITNRCCFQRGTPSAVGRTPCLHRHPCSLDGAEAMETGGESLGMSLLTSAAREALAAFPSAQFFAPGGKRAAPGFTPTRQGILDLYSGDAGVARWFSRTYNVWVLTFDFEHGPGQDLLDAGVQSKIFRALEAGAFAGLGAAPDCRSFSRAVTPAVRDAAHPFGKPGISANMREKVGVGNQHASFMLQVLLWCEEHDLPYWVENPDGSFLWILPPWLDAGIGTFDKSYRFDQCRFGTAWRKRTRLATTTGQRDLGLGGHSHQVLRGKSRHHSLCWTRIAQTYPRSLCAHIGAALGDALGLLPMRKKLKLAACARCNARVGEASHPGPARPHDQGPRDPKVLADMRLIEPQTAARQDKLWLELELWLSAQLSPETLDQLFLCPALAVAVLKSYALHLFASGRRLYELRYTLIAVQNRFPHLRSLLSPAWAVVSKWEMVQPLKHRTPLPELLFKAMFVLAALKGWYRWVGTLLLGYEGIARIGEVLQAKRCDLLLPSDLLESDAGVAFLKIRQPKTRFRGRGRVQHLKVSNPLVLPFLERVFGSLDPSLALFPLSASMFRKRWDTLLDLLQVPLRHRPTPASIRGGGAILAYRRGEHIADILWRMRLVSLPTLSCYLQELAADSLISHLPPRVRHRIIRVATLFPLTLQSLGHATGVQARTYGDGLL